MRNARAFSIADAARDVLIAAYEVELAASSDEIGNPESEPETDAERQAEER